MSSKCIQGFKVLALRFSSDSTSHHEIFIKEHSVRNFDETKPPGKTLFVINVPPYATEDSLKRIFAKTGKIKSVSVSASREELKTGKGFKTAYVVYEKHDSLVKALKLNSLETLSSEEQPILTGLSKWVIEYNSNIYEHEKLYAEVTEFMKNHDKQEEKKKQQEKQVDDDGWTVVTKKGRNPGVSRKESVENKLIQKNKLKSRKRELKNFYTFQIKEQKMNNIIALRKSFQESKEKVNAMKQLRNFKPL